MEEQATQMNRHQEREGDNWIYMITGVIFILPLLWTTFGSEEKVARHPYNTTIYSLNWYLVFLFREIQGFFFLCISIFMKPKYNVLRNVLLLWPAFLILDHVLFYSQSPVRHLFSVIFMTYITWYHNEYELKNHLISIILLICFNVWFYIEYDHDMDFLNYLINPRFILVIPTCYILWYFLKIKTSLIWYHYKYE